MQAAHTHVCLSTSTTPLMHTFLVSLVYEHKSTEQRKTNGLVWCAKFNISLWKNQFKWMHLWLRVLWWHRKTYTDLAETDAGLLNWSHSWIPTEIFEDMGLKVSEMCSNTSVPFGLCWTCERETRLTVLSGSIDWHWCKSCFPFIQRVLVTFKENASTNLY